MIKLTNCFLDRKATVPIEFDQFIVNKTELINKFKLNKFSQEELFICLRIEFLLEIHLKHFLEQKELQYYAEYIKNTNKRLIDSVLVDQHNFVIIVQEFWKNKFTYVKFLIEGFYLVRNNHTLFLSMQKHLNEAGLLDYLLTLFNQISFTNFNGTLLMELNSPILRERHNFLQLLELLMLYSYNNEEAFLLKIIPLTNKQYLSSFINFIFHLPFQQCIENIKNFAIKLMEIILISINKSSVKDRMKKIYCDQFLSVIERNNFTAHPSFFFILEMFIKRKELNIMNRITERIELFPVMDELLDFRRKKKLSLSILKITKFMTVSFDFGYQCPEVKSICIKCRVYLKKQRNDIISSMIHGMVKLLMEKHKESFCKDKNIFEEVFSRF